MNDLLNAIVSMNDLLNSIVMIVLLLAGLPDLCPTMFDCPRPSRWKRWVAWMIAALFCLYWALFFYQAVAA